MPDETTTSFAMPAVDQPAATEIGVILAGLDVERLLAGLGMASLADDPTQVTLLVDQVRHGGGELTTETLHRIGARRWQAVRESLAAAGSGGALSGSVRQEWERATRIVRAADLGPLGPAAAAYLAACWLRHTAIDALTGTRPEHHQQEDRRAVSEVAAR